MGDNMEPIKGLARAMFEEAGDALFLLDPDTDQLLAVNPMAERVTGIPRKELLAMPATQLYRYGSPAGQQRLRRATTESGIFHSQEGYFLRSWHKEGWVPVNLTIVRLHLKPKTLA